MPSLNLRNVLRRNPDRPSLKARATALRNSAGRLIRQKPEAAEAPPARPAEATAHPDASLLALAVPFFRAWAHETASDYAVMAAFPAAQELHDAFVEACSTAERLARQVASIPATTPEGLGVKALAALYCSADACDLMKPREKPEGDAVTEDSFVWQVHEGVKRLAADYAETAAAHAPQPADETPPAVDLSGCSILQLARLYESLSAAQSFLGAEKGRPCFWTRIKESEFLGAKDFSPPGRILDNEYNRMGRLSDACAAEIARRRPASDDERDGALTARLTHELACEGRITSAALLRDINRTWRA